MENVMSRYTPPPKQVRHLPPIGTPVPPAPKPVDKRNPAETFGKPDQRGFSENHLGQKKFDPPDVLFMSEPQPCPHAHVGASDHCADRSTCNAPCGDRAQRGTTTMTPYIGQKATFYPCVHPQSPMRDPIEATVTHVRDDNTVDLEYPVIGGALAVSAAVPVGMFPASHAGHHCVLIPPAGEVAHHPV